MCGIAGLYTKIASAAGATRRASGARCSGSSRSAGPTARAWRSTATRRRRARARSRCTPRDPSRTGTASGSRARRGVRRRLASRRPRHPRDVRRRRPTPTTRRRGSRERHPELPLMSAGSTIEIYKEAGPPAEFVRRFALAEIAGTHALGHTRMATESRVTTAALAPVLHRARPVPGAQRLAVEPQPPAPRAAREGIHFQTDNDSEVAAGYLTWRLREGATLEQALEAAWTTSTASTRSRSARPTASRCCATRSRASRR